MPGEVLWETGVRRESSDDTTWNDGACCWNGVDQRSTRARRKIRRTQWHRWHQTTDWSRTCSRRSRRVPINNEKMCNSICGTIQLQTLNTYHMYCVCKIFPLKWEMLSMLTSFVHYVERTSSPSLSCFLRCAPHFLCLLRGMNGPSTSERGASAPPPLLATLSKKFATLLLHPRYSFLMQPRLLFSDHPPDATPVIQVAVRTSGPMGCKALPSSILHQQLQFVLCGRSCVCSVSALWRRLGTSRQHFQLHPCFLW